MIVSMMLLHGLAIFKTRENRQILHFDMSAHTCLYMDKLANLAVIRQLEENMRLENQLSSTFCQVNQLREVNELLQRL